MGINGSTDAQQFTYNTFDNTISGMGMLGTDDENVPAAYLNYILFDKNMLYYQHGHNYLAPKGTPAAMRSSAPGTTNTLSSYQVVKPFPVQMGTTAPAFGQFEGGTQYLTPVRIQYLVEHGYLKPIF